jgi:hypothetical protein
MWHLPEQPISIGQVRAWAFSGRPCHLLELKRAKTGEARGASSGMQHPYAHQSSVAASIDRRILSGTRVANGLPM